MGWTSRLCHGQDLPPGGQRHRETRAHSGSPRLSLEHKQGLGSGLKINSLTWIYFYISGRLRSRSASPNKAHFFNGILKTIAPFNSISLGWLMWRECGEAAASPSPIDPTAHTGGIPFACWSTAWEIKPRAQVQLHQTAQWARGRVGRQERSLTLENILAVGVRNEREWKSKDRNERNGYLDSIQNVPANGIYLRFFVNIHIHPSISNPCQRFAQLSSTRNLPSEPQWTTGGCSVQCRNTFVRK